MDENGQHRYRANLIWTGAAGGMPSYREYDRTHQIACPGKPMLTASSDPAFFGAPDLWNPEDMLVAALSSCHMLSYLACCAKARIEVLSYTDEAEGVMAEDGKGGGRFVEVVLNPRVAIADPERTAQAERLHETAHKHCFIANSVNFSVAARPVVTAH